MAGVATAATIGLTGWLAIGSTAVAVGSSAASFAQAGKSKRAQRDAESEAEAMMRTARRRLNVNYMEQLAIKKEPYELQREAMLQAGATALDAAREGDQRGVAATAGRLQQAQNQAQAQTRAAMSKEQQAIEMAVAKEDSRLRDLNVQLDLGEIEGQQRAAADAQRMAAASTQAGISAAGTALQSGLSQIPLYQQNTALQKAALGNTQLTADEFAAIGNVDVGMGEAAGEGFTNLDLTRIPGMTNREFRQFRRGLDADQKALLFGSQSYQTQYGLGLTANRQQAFQNQAMDSGNADPLPPSDFLQVNTMMTDEAKMARLQELMNKMSFGGGLTVEEQAEVASLRSSLNS